MGITQDPFGFETWDLGFLEDHKKVTKRPSPISNHTFTDSSTANP